MSESVRVTEEQIAAAQLRLSINQKLGQGTDSIIRMIASMLPGQTIGDGNATQQQLISLMRVSSRALGIAVMDPDDPEPTRRFLHVILDRDVRLPAEAQERFRTVVPNQRTIIIDILEQASAVPSSDLGDNRLIGQVTLHDLPAIPTGIAIVDIIFSLSIDLTLTVDAVELHSGLHAQVELEVNREFGTDSSPIIDRAPSTGLAE